MADQESKNNTLEVPETAQTNNRKKRMVVAAVALVLVAAIIGGGIVWRQRSQKQEAEDRPTTVMFEGHELIVPDYLKDAQPTQAEAPPDSQVIQDLEAKLATEGVTEDSFGTNTYVALAQLYYAEGNNQKAIENYELARQYISQKEGLEDKEAQLARIDEIIATIKGEE